MGLSVVCIRTDEAFLSFPGGKRGVLSMQFGRSRATWSTRVGSRDRVLIRWGGNLESSGQDQEELDQVRSLHTFES